MPDRYTIEGLLITQQLANRATDPLERARYLIAIETRLSTFEVQGQLETLLAFVEDRKASGVAQWLN